MTKPLGLQQTKRYLWKDNVHIFHLAPRDWKSAHLLGHSGLLKIMAHFGDGKKMSDTSISSSLSAWHRASINMKSTHDDEDMREMMNGGWGQRFATIQAEEFTNGVASICTPQSCTSSSKKYLGVTLPTTWHFR